MPRKSPVDYSAELAQRICDDLASGMSLRKICKQRGYPAIGSVLRWLADEKYASFREQYARAKELQCEVLASEIIDIADTSRKGKKLEVKEVARECSVCGKDLRWRGAWRHSIDGTSMCAGAKAEKVMETKTVTGDMVDRSRLQVDARKWYLSKVMPKKYGDRLELAGDADNPITVSVAETIRAARRRRLEHRSDTALERAEQSEAGKD